MKKALLLSLVSVLLLTGCTQAEQEEVTDILLEDEQEVDYQAMDDDDDNESETMEAEAEPEEAMEEQTLSETEEVETVYTQAEYTTNRAVLDEAGPKVIYFHADWCPTCRVLEANLKETLSEFPKGTKIVQLNYDSEKDLKKQYGVKTQTSVVVLDADGNRVGNVLVNPSNAQLIEVINQTL